MTSPRNRSSNRGRTLAVLAALALAGAPSASAIRQYAAIDAVGTLALGSGGAGPSAAHDVVRAALEPRTRLRLASLRPPLGPTPVLVGGAVLLP